MVGWKEYSWNRILNTLPNRVHSLFKRPNKGLLLFNTTNKKKEGKVQGKWWIESLWDNPF